MGVIGTTLITPTTTYSKWFPRSGDAATFFVEVLTSTVNADGQFNVTVQTKNTEDDDSSPAAWNFPTILMQTLPTTVKVWSLRVEELKELVRFKFDWDVGTPAGVFAHFRMLPPAWEFN